MAEPMTVREVARVLGISKAMVQIIEARAIAKLRAAKGLVSKGVPAWVSRVHKAKGNTKCGRCGELGHNARGCTHAR